MPGLPCGRVIGLEGRATEGLTGPRPNPEGTSDPGGAARVGVARRGVFTPGTTLPDARRGGVPSVGALVGVTPSSSDREAKAEPPAPAFTEALQEGECPLHPPGDDHAHLASLLWRRPSSR